MQLVSIVMASAAIFYLCELSGLPSMYLLFIFAPLNVLFMLLAFCYIRKLVRFGGPLYAHTYGLACAKRALGIEVELSSKGVTRSELLMSAFRMALPGLSLWMFTLTVAGAIFDVLTSFKRSLCLKYWYWRGPAESKNWRSVLQDFFARPAL